MGAGLIAVGDVAHVLGYALSTVAAIAAAVIGYFAQLHARQANKAVNQRESGQPKLVEMVADLHEDMKAQRRDTLFVRADLEDLRNRFVQHLSESLTAEEIEEQIADGVADQVSVHLLDVTPPTTEEDPE